MGRVLNAGFEGDVAKDEMSPYGGGVTRSWLKVKFPGMTDPEDPLEADLGRPGCLSWALSASARFVNPPGLLRFAARLLDLFEVSLRPPVEPGQRLHERLTEWS